MPTPPRPALLLILASMLATVTGLRLYLHLVQVQHIYLAGHPIHHLFSGALLVIAAVILQPSGARGRPLAPAKPLALGSGSGMVLDEVVFLIATDWSDAAYCSAVSLWGAVALVGLGAGLLLVLYAAQGGEARQRPAPRPLPDAPAASPGR
jgi:hypothetical protein